MSDSPSAEEVVDANIKALQGIIDYSDHVVEIMGSQLTEGDFEKIDGYRRIMYEALTQFSEEPNHKLIYVTHFSVISAICVQMQSTYEEIKHGK